MYRQRRKSLLPASAIACTNRPPTSPYAERAIVRAAIATWTSSPRTKMVFLRHVPPAPVTVLKNFCIRFDDPICARPSSTRVTGATCNPSRRPKDQAFRRAVTTRRETADHNRLGFVAGRPTGCCGRGCRARPSPSREKGASEAFTAVELATPSRYRRSAPSYPDRAENEILGAGGQTGYFVRSSAITRRSTALLPLSTAAGICTVAVQKCTSGASSACPRSAQGGTRAASCSALCCAVRSRVWGCRGAVAPRRQAGLFGRAPPIARRPTS